MRVPLLDLKAQYETVRGDVEAAVRAVFEAQAFVLGPAVERCEEALARYVGARHACGVSSGTDALLVALWALGVGPGDEVVTSPFTFFATAGSIHRLGARPVFVDVAPETLNLDAAQLAAALGSRTKAIVPVHLYGRMADLDGVLSVAERAGGIPVVEDAAQAIGARSAGGRSAGASGAYGCFSFFPSKNLGGAGDGGLVVTNDDDLAARVRELRVHGSLRKYHHRVVGANFRLDALQAAVVHAKLPYLDGWTAARNANARRYDRLLAEAGLAPGPVRPLAPPAVGERHVYNQYVVRVDRRDALRDHLAAAGVGTEVYYPVPLHLQECFASLGYRAGAFPEAEQAARDSLALPVYPELGDDAAVYVVECMRSFYGARAV